MLVKITGDTQSDKKCQEVFTPSHYHHCNYDDSPNKLPSPIVTLNNWYSPDSVRLKLIIYDIHKLYPAVILGETTGPRL